MMVEVTMFQEARAALEAGDIVRARDLLTRLLKTEPNNPEYWLWMSAVVETTKERTYCLQEVLKRDPKNVAARRGLVLIGALPPDATTLSPTPPRRNWERVIAGLVQDSTPIEPKGRLVRRLLIMAGAVVGLTVLLLIAFMGANFIRPGMVQLRRTGMPITMAPTSTYLPTNTPVVRSPTPTFIGPTPLWMFLEATYTPTALYVDTPHPRIEAYRSAINAFKRGDYSRMIDFMNQVLQGEPTAADAAYYIGEAYRLQKDYARALTQYNAAIQINPDFAPAYLGRARVLPFTDPKAEIGADLETAIQKDPNFAEAYLARAIYLVESKEYTRAEADLRRASELLPQSPLVMLVQAQVALAQGETVRALSLARKANQGDLTMLEAYLVMAQAAQKLGDYASSIEPLSIYLRYESENLSGHLMLAEAYQKLGKTTDALSAYDQVLQLDRRYTRGYLERAQLYLTLKQYQNALDDFDQALRLEPKSFEAGMGKGQALFLLGYAGDAYMQIEKTVGYAEGHADFALIYYWRSQALAKLGQVKVAAKDWEALLALSADIVPAEWRTYAAEQLAAYYTPTPTLTPSPSPTPSFTAPVAGATPSNTPTTGAVRTNTPTPSRTSTPTP